jgi:polysaccharide export outer membrane protein
MLALAAGLALTGSLAFAQNSPSAAAPALVGGQQNPVLVGPTVNNGAQTPNQNRPANSNNQQNPQQQNNFDPVTGRRLSDSDRDKKDNEKGNDYLDRSGGTQPLSEFQQLVANSTGRNLPIFGASLFGGSPSTFAPVDDIPVTPDYTVGPGDQIHVQAFGNVSLQETYGVDRTGSIFIPQVGTLHVAGMRFSDLHDYLRSEFGRVFRNFDLTVSMGQLRSIPIFVLGQANFPGRFTIGSLSTLLNALFASGGPTGQGSLRDLQVKRDGKTIVHFDLYDLLLRGDKSKDIRLEPGDIIFIPQIGPQVAISGSVSNPAIYELHGETTVKQLVDLAGGYTNVAATASARLERIYEHTERSILDLDLKASATTELHNGDIVTIAPILSRFKDAVTLRGNVANPGRYVWHEGMRMLDLIPSRDALVTRNYYDKVNQLGSIPNQASNGDKSGELGVRSGIAPAGSTGGGGGGASSSAPVAAALADSGSTFGAANDVVLPAPDIDWSYAVISRQSKVDLTTSLVTFSPGKLFLEGDQTQNIELLPGDVVTIFSKADIRVPVRQQTRFVHLEGEFAAPGTYSLLPGETLRQLLRRVGGLTQDAYLFASQFTRESTRRLEAQRLQDFADTLSAQVSAENIRLANSSFGATDPAAATADARLAVERLRRVQPQGRIVLSMLPDSRGIDGVPDLALEDGDRFIVPRTPSSVAVQGQVYNANAFLFERGRRVSGYLHQAGGPDRLADKKRMFVVRADGSVYSQQYGNVARANMFPGDTIVVPPVLSHSNLLRNMVLLASLASNVGFNVAALLYLTR